MHELSLAEAIVSALLKMYEDEGWSGVKRVRLRIGALRQVFPDMLEFGLFDVRLGVGYPLLGRFA